MRPGERDALAEQCLIAPGALGGPGDRAQVGEAFQLRCFSKRPEARPPQSCGRCALHREDPLTGA
jgi:hypothetical protein